MRISGNEPSSPPPPVYQEAADIRDVYLYKSSLCKWGLGTRGMGTMFYRQKIKGVSAYNTQNTL